MGSQLTPLIETEKIGLKGVYGKVLAVDALNAVYQFLALVRVGTEPLRNRRGLVTSHLVGIATRYSKLALEYRCSFIFVFDGPPHPLKAREIERRRELRRKAREEYERLLAEGRLEEAFSKAVVAVSVDEWTIESAKRLVRLMGFPVVEAPADAEAQAALIVSRGEAWAVSSQDWDSLLYGAPRLVRYVTLTGFEWLPSKQQARRLEPELAELEKVLKALGITRRQLVEIAVLVGTDYNEGVEGVGPKTCLQAHQDVRQLGQAPRRHQSQAAGELRGDRRAVPQPSREGGLRARVQGAG
jgi:flap endonuclease-1